MRYWIVTLCLATLMGLGTACSKVEQPPEVVEQQPPEAGTESPATPPQAATQQPHEPSAALPAEEKPVEWYQERTAVTLRTVATCCEAYKFEHGQYPVADSADALKVFVEPAYIRDLPTRDAWDRPLVVSSSDSHYEIRSLGADGVADDASPAGVTADPDADIVFADGDFVQYPAHARGTGLRP